MMNARAALLAAAAFLSLSTLGGLASADDFPCGNGRPVVLAAVMDPEQPCGNGRPGVLHAADDYPCGNGRPMTA